MSPFQVATWNSIHAASGGVPQPVVALRLTGWISPETVRAALQDQVSRHEAFRTGFTQDRVTVHAADQLGAALLEELDLSALSEAEREREFQRLVRAQALRPFQLDAPPLLRALLVHLGPEQSLLILSASALACDRRALSRVAATLGHPPAPIPASSSVALATAHRQLIESPVAAEARRFWMDTLAGATGRLELAADKTGASTLPETGTVRTTLPESLRAKLVTAAAALGVEPLTLLLTAWATVLARYARQPDLTLGLDLPTAEELAEPALIALQEQLTPLRLRLELERSFATAAVQVQEATRRALGASWCPPPALPSLLLPPSSTALPLEVSFRTAGQLQEVSAFDRPAQLLPLDAAQPLVRLELAASVDEKSSAPPTALCLTYEASAFEARTAHGLLGHTLVLLEAGLDAPTVPLCGLPLLSHAESEQWVKHFNATQTPVPKHACVQHLFEAQVERTPDAIAAVHGEVRLTYAELDARAEKLAAFLSEKGLTREGRVGLFLSPSVETLVALLGILKAGGAYVPLDIDAPAERLEQILSVARAEFVLTQEALSAKVPAAGRMVVRLDRDWAEIQATGPRMLPEPDPEQLAYVLFTSGSTGEPKGVLIPHRAVVNHNLAMARRFELRPSDRMLQFTPIHFDAAGEEIFPPLLSGSTVEIRGELVPTSQFARLIEEAGLTVLSLPPAFLHEWVNELKRQGAKIPRGLRLVILGGEKLLAETLSLWREVGGEEVPWMNVYGPTEATITSSVHELSPGVELPNRPSLPIGRPIANAQLYLVDERLELVAPGQAGELCIAGRGLARGYLGNADQTAEKFVPDPFGQTAGARMYRTGDLARLLEDGNLEFLGRIDHQVKIRGFRIELGEVESALRTHPQVEDAVVMAREDQPGRKQLVGYTVCKGGAPSAAELREHLGRTLPDYMVPAAFVVLEALPLTANGKVDRKRLPAPTQGGAMGASSAAATELEELLSRTWCEVLGLDQVGLDEDFFELGGHSLLVTQVLARVEESFGFELPLTDFFDATTVRTLAARLQVRRDEAAPSEVKVDQMSDDEVERMLRELASS